MKIKRLYINNYKSLVDFELVEPNPFSVFVGPNAAGKSNIFEALEFFSYWIMGTPLAINLFGGAEQFLNKNYQYKNHQVELETHIELVSGGIKAKTLFLKENNVFKSQEPIFEDDLLTKSDFIFGFSRLFIKNYDAVKIKTNGDKKLRIDAANFASVLKRVMSDANKKEEIIDWLRLFLPEFEDIQINRDNLSGIDTVLVKEKHTNQFFKTDLLSDGTIYILSLLTAVYQSDEPQFLCIEEPENGLNPNVIRELVGFFRQVCEEKGHYIWLNTHSATLVKELEPKELILINKIEGVTRAKQLDKDLEFKSIPLDEAWLTNTLGGGIPW